MPVLYIQQNQLEQMLAESCSKIASIYSLNNPNAEFISYLAFTLKKHFGYLEIEQIDLAFEYNSIGSLNDFLPRLGNSADNKVKFSVPDFIKIIKAFVKCKGLDKQFETPKNSTDNETKNYYTQRWCNSLMETFNKYADTGKLDNIILPLFTARVLIEIGVLDENSIKNTKEYYGLICKSFDSILSRGESLELYLKKYRDKYISVNELELPDF